MAKPESAETAYYRGEGGSVFRMDLPLPEIMAEKVTKGYLRRVNADGSPYRDPDTEQATGDGDKPPPRPAQSANKAEWVGYAVLVGGMTPDDAEAMTKQDLIDRFGSDE